MKKTFIFMLVAIILGTVTGKLLFSEYSDVEETFKESNKAYFIEEGIYLTKSSLKNNTKSITPKLVIRDKNKYHVYVGITSNNKNASKIQRVFQDKGYNVGIRKQEINNDEFMTNLEQFDVLVESANSKEIENIEKIVLSNYENLVSYK